MLKRKDREREEVRRERKKRKKKKKECSRRFRVCSDLKTRIYTLFEFLDFELVFA